MRRTANDHRARRGATMLMVLMTLMTGTIIGAAYLSSRDNSAPLADNVTRSAAARGLATAGLEVGVAVLQTESDWRTNHVGGKLIDDHPLGAGTIDIDLTDRETGLAPTADTNEVRIVCTAVVGDVEQDAVADATVTPSAGGGGGTGSIPVDLPEFAVFSNGKIHLKEDATIARWSTSPLADAGRRITLSTRRKTASSVSLSDNAVAIDTTVITMPGASGSLVSNASGPAIQTVAINDDIPVPGTPAIPVAGPGGSSPPNFEPASPVVLSSDARYHQVRPTSGLGTITLDGDITLVAENDLVLEPDSGVIVDGDATIVVFANLLMDEGSYIELRPDATLELFVAGDVTIKDAFIGEWRTDKSVRDNSGAADWMDPSRVYLYSTGGDHTWVVELNSVIKGSLYGPDAYLLMKDDSALYGRAAVNRIDAEGHASIFYDHTIDPGTGYNNADSEIFKNDGTILDEVLALASLDPSDMEALAESASLSFQCRGEVYGSAELASGPPVPLNEPTPRTVTVEYTLRECAGDVIQWEQDKGSGG